MLFKPILERSQDIDTGLQIALAGSMHLRTDLRCCLSAGAALVMLRQTCQGTADEVVHLRFPHIVPSLVLRLIWDSIRIYITNSHCSLVLDISLRVNTCSKIRAYRNRTNVTSSPFLFSRCTIFAFKFSALSIAIGRGKRLVKVSLLTLLWHVSSRCDDRAVFGFSESSNTSKYFSIV